MSEDAAATPQVQVNFALEIGWGTMQIATLVPAERVNLVQLLPALRQISSNITDAVIGAVEEKGDSVSCKKGCGACCRQFIPVSLFELEALADWVRTLPAEQQAILANRFRAALAALNEAGILERLDFQPLPQIEGAKEKSLVLDYFNAGVPCPFLQDESCGIYPIRPLICREYAVTSPAEFCSEPTPETVKPTPRPVKLSQALFSLGHDITTPKRGLMPLVFLFAWMESGMTVARAYEGTGQELLRLVMERIAITDDAPTTMAG